MGGVRTGIGLVRAFRRSPYDFLAALLAAGAATKPVRVGTERVLLLIEPDEAWQFLTAHHRQTGKGRGAVRARVILGHGLLTSEGTAHREHRLALQPGFSAAAAEAGRDHIAATARARSDRWIDRGEVDLAGEMSAIALDAAARVLFGDDLRDRADDVARSLANLQNGFGVAMAPGGRAVLASPLPVARRERAAQQQLGEMAESIGGRRSGVLRLLGDATPTEVRDEAMTLLLAGHETRAATLTWMLAAIAESPTLRRRLEAEWDDGGRDLRLTRAVVAETLRMWPPSWTFTRRVLAPIDLGARQIPAGLLVLIPPLLLHRDSRWWARAETFDPDRWLDQGGVFRDRIPGQPRGAYLPFGAGPRRCIGEHVAWVEAATILAELGRDWRVEPLHPLAIGPSSMTLRPRSPVPAVTKRRR